LWEGSQAEQVRKKVRCCDRDCWMIGSVSTATKKYIWKPGFWVAKHKFLRYFKNKQYFLIEIKLSVIIKMEKLQKKNLINAQLVICAR